MAGGFILSWRWAQICGLGLYFRLDGFRIVYLCVTAFLWIVSSLFSAEYFARAARTGRYHLFSLLTFCATVGVFLSGDLFTTFVFFEIMSLSSYPMVAHDETPSALKAAETYLAVALIGGMTTLMGLLLLHGLIGTLEMELLHEACKAVGNRSALYAAGALILVGFGAKAGIFPLHIWLPKAHPAAPAPGSALLSGILTKCGVFGVIIVSFEIFRNDASWGLALLVLGAITMLLGAVLAVFSIDLKRTLACSSVSQIGFIVTGIAMQCILAEHNALAVRGTILHMVNHSLLKLTLFLAAGVVYMNLHSIDFNDIRGFGRGKPLFTFVFLTAAAGIAGVPLFNGYISKTLLHESIVEGIHLYSGSRTGGILRIVELLFLFTGGLTVSYMLKLTSVLFGEKPIGKNPGNEKTVSDSRYLRPITTAALTLSAAILPVLGVFPRLMDSIANLGEGFMHGHAPEHAVHYFDWINLKGAVYSLMIGAAVYMLFIRKILEKKDTAGSAGAKYLNMWPRFLDLENLVYRPVIYRFTHAGVLIFGIVQGLPDALIGFIRKTLLRPLKPGRFPGKFFGRYYDLIYPEKSKKPEMTAAYGGFSASLLLFGIGLCATLGYLMFLAFK